MKRLALTKMLTVGALAGLILGCGSSQQSSVPSMPTTSGTSSPMPSSGAPSAGGGAFPSMPSAPGAPMPSSSSGSSAGGASSAGGGVSVGAGGLPGASVGFPGASTGQGGMTGSGTRSGNGSAGTSGNASARDGSGGPGASGDDYGLDNLPGSLGDGPSGPMSAQERAAILAGTLNDGYQDFDGFILEERARAQGQANGVRDTGVSGAGTGNGGAGDSSQAAPVVVGASSSGGGQGPAGVIGGTTNAEAQQFPVPDDIPSGRDDDVVARQLREAAMAEPDPALREKLWDEYRKYTGLEN
ncbi:MAG: hypothetical protein R3332_06700 [Pseudohongiellaceae bacterium]|nr:hypothetical protein [Pseudohongiellaceae bacterium]